MSPADKPSNCVPRYIPAEMAADKAEKSSKMTDRRSTRDDSTESSDGEVIVPVNPSPPEACPARLGVPGW